MARYLTAIIVHPRGWHIACDLDGAPALLGITRTLPSGVASSRDPETGNMATVVLSDSQSATGCDDLAVQNLVDTVGQLKLQAPQVVLAVPSRWCMAAPIASEDLPRQHRRQAMTFKLEERLPVDAESLVADFMGGPTGTLGVALLRSHGEPLVQALEDAGIHVAVITPTVLLAQQVMLDDQAGRHLAIHQTHGELDVLDIVNGVCTGWQHIDDVAALHRALQRLRLTGQPVASVATTDLCGDTRATVDVMFPDLAPLHLDDTVIGQAAQAASQIAVRGQTPWVNFRRDALACSDRWTAVRRPLTALLAASWLLMASVVTISLWRGYQFEATAIDFDQKQAAIFSELFPRQAVPPQGAIASRLRSETRKLEGTSGQTSDVPRRSSAIQMLHQALSGLPRNLRFRVLELRLDGQRFYLDGQARSHGDAESVAAGLRRALPMTIDPPRTENLEDKGVAFTIIGIASDAPSAAARQGGDQ